MRKLNEKCAVFGIFNSPQMASRQTYFGLFALQHRGQEQTGIVSTDGKKIFHYMDSGLVSQVYNENIISKLKGSAAIGHNRYSTSRGTSKKHGQPVIFNQTVAFAHNGNLPSTEALEKFFKEKGVKIRKSSDSEMMAHAIGYYMKNGNNLGDAIEKAYPLFTGAFSCVALSTDELVGFRDPRGIRPLVLGKKGGETIIASETCALDTVGAKFVREIKPGEMVRVSKKGIKSKILVKMGQKFDIFEFVYFSRHDSMLLGKSVYEVRRNFGKYLAKETKHLKLDMIIPVPETSIPAAIGYAREAGIDYEIALNKNRYIYRTFIEPKQLHRDEKVKMKLTVLKSVIEGKKVGILDDSIVRGTTSRQIVKMFFEAGAKEVHFLVGSPPVKFPDFYGIDTPMQKDLIASQKNVKEIEKHLGATSLNFLSVEGLVKATGLSKKILSLSPFDGKYPLPIFKHEEEIRYDV